MKKEPILVIMAAGMGSRYGGLKQIEPVSGENEVILDFSLYDALMAGFKRAILIIKEENRDAFKALVDEKAGKHMDIQYAYQKLEDLPEGFSVPEGRVKPWGTGHAVLSAKDLIDAPFAVINSDDYYGPGAFQTIYDYLINAEDGEYFDYSMVGYMVENTLTENGTVARGVCREDENGNLAEIHERLKIKWHGDGIAYGENDEEENWIDIPRGTVVSMNFWGFTPSIVTEMKNRFPAFLEKAMAENPMKGEYLLPRIVDDLIKDGLCKVKVLKSNDVWCGVTYKEDKEGVVNTLQSMKDRGEYPEKLWR